MILPADCTFNLVMNKGGLDYLMCSSDQIKRRVNMYRDKAERVFRLGDLEDEDSDNNNNKVGGGGTMMTPSTAKNTTRKHKKNLETTTLQRKIRRRRTPTLPSGW